MKYKMDESRGRKLSSGIDNLMSKHPGINQAVRQAAERTHAIARSRAPVKYGNLRASGRVENAGIQPVMKGQKRITWRVVFYARYAMDAEMRTGFLSGSVGRRRT